MLIFFSRHSSHLLCLDASVGVLRSGSRTCFTHQIGVPTGLQAKAPKFTAGETASPGSVCNRASPWQRAYIEACDWLRRLEFLDHMDRCPSNLLRRTLTSYRLLSPIENASLVGEGRTGVHERFITPRNGIVRSGLTPRSCVLHPPLRERRAA